MVGAVRRVSLYVNKAAHDALPAAYKEAVNIASGWVNQWMMAAYDTRNPAAYKRMIGSGTRVQLFPNNFMIAAYRGAFAIYDAEAAANPAFKKIYDPGSATVPRSMNGTRQPRQR